MDRQLFLIITPLIGKILWNIKEQGHELSRETENKLYNELLDKVTFSVSTLSPLTSANGS